jgi:hypothetical protein
MGKDLFEYLADQISGDRISRHMIVRTARACRAGMSLEGTEIGYRVAIVLLSFEANYKIYYTERSFCVSSSHRDGFLTSHNDIIVAF